MNFSPRLCLGTSLGPFSNPQMRQRVCVCVSAPVYEAIYIWSEQAFLWVTLPVRVCTHVFEHQLCYLLWQRCAFNCRTPPTPPRALNDLKELKSTERCVKHYMNFLFWQPTHNLCAIFYLCNSQWQQSIQTHIQVAIIFNVWHCWSTCLLMQLVDVLLCRSLCFPPAGVWISHRKQHSSCPLAEVEDI